MGAGCHPPNNVGKLLHMTQLQDLHVHACMLG